MASKIEVDEIFNAGGDNDTGIDLSTNDQIVLKTANTTRLTMNATGQTTIVGEGGSTTTSVQQGLAKCWFQITQDSSHSLDDSFNVGIGENSDVLEAIEKELEVIAKYDDQLNVLKKYFT